MQATFPNPETTQPTTRLRGFIKSDKATLGYCFVRGDDGNTYFLHANELEGGEKKMVKRAMVEFTPFPIGVPGKCDRAVNAIVILEAREQRTPSR